MNRQQRRAAERHARKAGAKTVKHYREADLIAALKSDGVFDAGDVIFWATQTPGVVNISANAEGRAHYERACKWGELPSGFPEGWLGASIVIPDDPIASDELALQLAKKACARGMRAIALLDPTSLWSSFIPTYTKISGTCLCCTRWATAVTSTMPT